jgi:uncharacterized membrane protein YeiH
MKKMIDPTPTPPQMFTEYFFGLKTGHVVAGMFAGFVRNVLSPEKDHTLGQNIMATIAGAVSAGYLTVPIIHVLNINYEFENSAAFVIGLISMQIVNSFIRASKHLDFRNLFTNLIKK